jgi:hypothetical protein
MRQRILKSALEGLDNEVSIEPAITDTIHTLGVLYLGQGKLKEAIEMLQFALKLKEKTLGRDHASTLASGAILYLIYLSEDRRVEADEMYRWVAVSCEYSSFHHALETENHLRLILIRKLLWEK